MVVKRFDIWLVNLDPTIGSEIKKVRPCLVVSYDTANANLDTVIAVPLTSTIRNYPMRLQCSFQNKQGQLATDQLRCVDKIRLVKKLGTLEKKTCIAICELLQEMFAY